LVLCEPVSAGIITQWDFESTTSNDPSIEMARTGWKGRQLGLVQ
jgi:hypothetical protein